jgi:predicted ATP-grasp superfamily ATP-dependent carboligase
MTALELLNQAEALRRNNRFGEAINIYREAASATDATDDIRRKALASVELIQEINGFVNVDLLNP